MNLKTFSIGIIDLLGIVVPGATWNILVFYLHVLHPETFSQELLKVSEALNDLFPNSQGLVNLSLFLFSSYVLGYISSLIPLRIFDRITLLLANLDSGMEFLEVWRINRKKKLHPYDFLYEDQIAKLKELNIGGAALLGKSEKYFQMFFICKRYILQNSQVLWLEAERKEAELRLINGLFYSTSISCFLLFLGGQILLAIIGLGIAVLLAIGFRRRRHAEVAFVYHAAAIVAKEMQ
jgi:hypothetical protein